MAEAFPPVSFSFLVTSIRLLPAARSRFTLLARDPAEPTHRYTGWGGRGLSRTRTLLPLGMRILPSYVLMISYCFFIIDVLYTCAPAEFFVALNLSVFLGYFFFSFSLAGVGIQFVLLQQPGADLYYLAEIDTLKLVLIVRTVQYCNALLISQGHQWC